MKRIVALAALTFVLAACTNGGESTAPGSTSASPSASSPTGVFVSGPLLVRPAPDEASPMMLITGTVTVDGLCAKINGNPAVWPYGTAYDPERGEILTSDGKAIKVGDMVYSGGGSVTLDALNRESFTGEALDVLTSCMGSEGTILYLHGPSTTPPTSS